VVFKSPICYFFHLGRFLLVMGPGQFFVARVKSGQVGSAIFGLSLGFENSPKNPKFFNFICHSGQKNLTGLSQKVPWSKTGWPLIYCKSKVCSGHVGLGQGPSLIFTEFLLAPLRRSPSGHHIH